MDRKDILSIAKSPLNLCSISFTVCVVQHKSSVCFLSWEISEYLLKRSLWQQKTLLFQQFLANWRGEENPNKQMIVDIVYACLSISVVQKTLFLIYICTLMVGWWYGCISVEHSFYKLVYQLWLS